MESKENSSSEGNRRWRRRMNKANLNKSPSAPDLTGDVSGLVSLGKGSRTTDKESFKAANRNHRESVRPLGFSKLLLRPSHLQRQALSMDNPFYDSCDCCTPPSARLSRQHSRRSAGSRDSFDVDFGSSAAAAGSQTSMALDLHECQVTLKVKDESVTKRSDTARRHQLLRQKPVEDDSHSALSKCPCTAMFFLAPAAEKCGVGTKLSPCHHWCRPTTNAGERTRIPKITADFRSQSFSQACSCCDSSKASSHEGNPKVFCIDDHRRPNRSSENIRLYCDENLHCMRRLSPSVSPLRSPRQQRLVSSKCQLHRTKVSQNNPSTRRPARKLEGSLSAEEQYTPCTRVAVHPRSGSFSPTGHGVSSRDETNAQELH